MHVLADRAGLSSGYVSLLERGAYSDLRCETVVGLAEALGVTLDWLVLGRGDEPAWTASDDAAPSVYFAQADGKAGLIKIGFSSRPKHRVRQLLTGSAQVVLLCAVPGSKDDERALHKRFASARVHGEWFNPVPELLELITQAKGAA